jgi:preprotein translocase subunit SecA
MFIDKILTAIFGSQNDRDLKALKPILAKVNAKEEWAKSLPAEDFPKQTERFKEELKQGKDGCRATMCEKKASTCVTFPKNGDTFSAEL